MNPRYGARPVNNLFAKFIKKLVSELVLEEELRRVKSPGAKTTHGGSIVVTFDRATDEFAASFRQAGSTSASTTKTMKLDSLDLNSAR